MRRLARWPWIDAALVCAMLGGAAESTAIALGWWQLTTSGQVLACSVVAVVAAGAWARGGRRAEDDGRHSAATHARVLAGIQQAIDRGELRVPGGVLTEEPTADLPGPPYSIRDRRSPYGRPMHGGRRRTNPPARRPRGGPADA